MKGYRITLTDADGTVLDTITIGTYLKDDAGDLFETGGSREQEPDAFDYCFEIGHDPARNLEDAAKRLGEMLELADKDARDHE